MVGPSDRGRLELVLQVPPQEPWIAGRRIRLGDGALALVRAARLGGGRYRTVVDTGSAPVRRLRIGSTLARGARVLRVRLDGRRAGPARPARRAARGSCASGSTGGACAGRRGSRTGAWS